MITIHTKPSSTKNTKVDPDEFYGPPLYFICVKETHVILKKNFVDR